MVLSKMMLLCGFLGVAAAGAQQTVRSSAGQPGRAETTAAGIMPSQEIEAEAAFRLTQAGAKGGGDVYLSIAAEPPAGGKMALTLRIPLSSTGDAYGESRSCTVGPDGVRRLTFTAGLDERNYVGFKAAAEKKEIRLLLNKYLCRALAAPFSCGGEAVTLPGDWGAWRVGTRSAVVLESGMPATLELSPLLVVANGKAFDPGSCPVIAPSDGVCCVAGKTTNWHCGGRPKGAGWMKVSGDCFHHEVGTSCKD